MYRVSAQGFDALMRNVHYDYHYYNKTRLGPAPQVRSVDDGYRAAPVGACSCDVCLSGACVMILVPKR